MWLSDWVHRAFYGAPKKHDSVSSGPPQSYLGELPEDDEERRRVLVERHFEAKRRGRGVRIADGADSGMFPDG